MIERGQEIGESGDLLSRFGIHLGVPVYDFGDTDFYFMSLNAMPHVFYCTGLHISVNPMQYAHLETLVPDLPIDDGDSLYVSGVTVMAAHGMVRESDREWVFMGTDKSVRDTAAAYNVVAAGNHWQPVDAVMACNTGPQDHSERNVISHPLKIHSMYPVIYSGDTIYMARGAEMPYLIPHKGVDITFRSDDWHGIAEWLAFWRSPQGRSFRQGRIVPEQLTLPAA
jgi:hypothetical protein